MTIRFAGLARNGVRPGLRSIPATPHVVFYGCSCLTPAHRYFEARDAKELKKPRHGKELRMSNKAKTMIEQARALPPQDRITLVEYVLESLDRADPDIDRLWAREASERLATYRRGELVAKGLSDIIAKYRP